MKCLNCGFESKNDSKFCTRCGTPVQKNQTNDTYTAPNPQNNSSNQNTPNYGAPNYGAPNYSAPNQGAPNYSAPNQGAPNYGAPNYGAPNQGAPNQGAPNYGAPNYGAPNQGMPNYGVPPYGYTQPSPASGLLTVLREPMFMTICALITASAGCSLLGGGLPVIMILFAIFLWIAYSKAQKGIVDFQSMRRVSGTTYAVYIITNVAAITIIVCGVFISLAFSSIRNSQTFYKGFMEGLGESASEAHLEVLEELFYRNASNLTVIGLIVGFVFVVIGVIALIISILGYRKIHAFAKSVYQSIYNPSVPYENPQAVRGWLIAFGVYNSLSALGALSENILGALGNGCGAATLFIAAAMIEKHFIPPFRR